MYIFRYIYIYRYLYIDISIPGPGVCHRLLSLVSGWTRLVRSTAHQTFTDKFTFKIVTKVAFIPDLSTDMKRRAV